MLETAVTATEISEPEHFPCGSSVTLRLLDQTTSMKILKPFLPFTISQVYLVSPVDSETSLPSKLIMKVYDPRYLNQRVPCSFVNVPPRPWSLEDETLAAEYRHEIAEGQRVDEHDYYAFFRNLVTESHLWEDHFYRSMEGCYEAEVGSYEILEDLQGSVIPRFHSSGRLIPTDNRAIEPYVVLMEYIEGIPLSRIAAGTFDIPSNVYQPLWDAVKTFPGRGLYHDDINTNNVILCTPDAPSRMVLIDFGLAGLRGRNLPPEWDDKRWKEAVTLASDSWILKKTLMKAGIKVD